MNRKRIWIINHYADPPGIGKFNRHFNFAKKLQERGFEVTIFTASTIHTTELNMIKGRQLFRQEIVDGVRFVFVRTGSYRGNGYKRILNMIEYAYRVMRVTKKFGRADVIYSSSPHSLTWLAAHCIARRMKCPHIAETRDLWPETFVLLGHMKRTNIAARVLYAIEKFVYRRADRLIFTIPGGAEYVKSIGIDPNKVRYINNGIDLKRYLELQQKEKEPDADLDDDTKFNVVYAGALGVANNMFLVMDSMKLVLASNKNVRLLVYGSGGLEKEIKEYVKDNQITNVIFKGRIPKEKVPQVLVRSDLQLISVQNALDLYKYGISPNKLFDYMASGKPIISNIKCGYDLLEKYKCGITIETVTPESMAKCIIKFTQMSKDEYEEYCKNAKLTAQEFDFKKLTDKLESVITEVLEEKKSL